MTEIDESIVFAAIRQCLETADHYIRQGNRDAEFCLDRANAMQTASFSAARSVILNPAVFNRNWQHLRIGPHCASTATDTAPEYEQQRAEVLARAQVRCAPGF